MKTNEYVKLFHDQMPADLKGWFLEERGLSEEILDRFNLGFNGRVITIPILGKDGEFLYFKYRINPFVKAGKLRYWFDKGSKPQIYGWEHITEPKERLVICEGELDRLILETHGIAAISGTNGAMTFEDEWCEAINSLSSQVFISLDNDYAGLSGTEKLSTKLPKAKIVRIPQEEGIKDITEFVVRHGIGAFEKLLADAKSLEETERSITEKWEHDWESNKAKFPPITMEEVSEVLGTTIKRDDTNKIITFLCLLSAYTENSQFNISFNSPSSTGKSYIPIEVSSLFPEEGKKMISYSSPTAFFHDGIPNEKTGILTLDFSRQIWVFLDQPKPDLLQRLRPLCSHDRSITESKITDKTKNISNRTKTVRFIGFPALIFCSAGLRLDEQEATRFVLLSPEINEEKIREGIYEKILRESDPKAYAQHIESDPRRRALKERIEAIKSACVKNVNISEPEKLNAMFTDRIDSYKPRHQRDIGRVTSFIKIFALLNLWHRERNGQDIIANWDDVKMGMALWDKISACQNLNLPPYVFNIYKDIILPAYAEKKSPLTRQEIMKKHFEIYGRPISDWQLGRDVLFMLEASGLIVQEKDPDDNRKRLVQPLPDKESATGLPAQEQFPSLQDAGRSPFLETNINDDVYITDMENAVAVENMESPFNE